MMLLLSWINCLVVVVRGRSVRRHTNVVVVIVIVVKKKCLFFLLRLIADLVAEVGSIVG